MERYRKQRDADTRRRGDTVKAVRVTGRRVTLSRSALSSELSAMPKQSGFTLIELVMTITIMTILTLGVMPLVKVSVKRQREQQLRDALRQMRIAIDEFHRDTVGMICTGSVAPLPGNSSSSKPSLSTRAAGWRSPTARFSEWTIRIDIPRILKRWLAE